MDVLTTVDGRETLTWSTVQVEDDLVYDTNVSNVGEWTRISLSPEAARLKGQALIRGAERSEANKV